MYVIQNILVTSSFSYFGRFHVWPPPKKTWTGMPAECLPKGKRGRLSYTIHNEASGARVEVLLKGKAFRVVKLGCDQNGILEVKLWGKNIGYWREIDSSNR